VHCFAFNFKELGKLKGQEVWIILDDDTFIFQWLYRLSDMEWTLVKVWTEELLEASSVEFFRREYASAIVMPTKKDIFRNGCTFHLICGQCSLNYHWQRQLTSHYEIMSIFKIMLTSSTLNYSWFVQYMKKVNGDIGIIQFFLGIIFSPYIWNKLNTYVFMVNRCIISTYQI
jgi:hypothetical protein